MVWNVKLQDGIFANHNYPNHEAIDFYTHYKEDIKLFAEMDLSVLELLLHGHTNFCKWR